MVMNASCRHNVASGDSYQFCPACGVRLSQSRWSRIYHVGLPLVAAVASFLPWIRIGLGRHPASWTVYRVSPWAWAWLFVDMVVMAISAWPRGGMSYRVVRLWQLLGAATLSVGITVLLSIGLAKTVSTTLAAPSPVHLSVGLVPFIGIVTVWTILALLE